MKSGTTMKTAMSMKAASKSGVRHGPSNKNVNATRKAKPKPSGPTKPIKGMDRGGV